MSSTTPPATIVQGIANTIETAPVIVHVATRGYRVDPKGLKWRKVHERFERATGYTLARIEVHGERGGWFYFWYPTADEARLDGYRLAAVFLIQRAGK